MPRERLYTPSQGHLRDMSYIRAEAEQGGAKVIPKSQNYLLISSADIAMVIGLASVDII